MAYLFHAALRRTLTCSAEIIILGRVDPHREVTVALAAAQPDHHRDRARFWFVCGELRYGVSSEVLENDHRYAPGVICSFLSPDAVALEEALSSALLLPAGSAVSEPAEPHAENVKARAVPTMAGKWMAPKSRTDGANVAATSGLMNRQ